MQKVSVLVLNYNGVGFLGPCLRSLEELSYPDYEIIVVDNASTDDSVEYVRRSFPLVKLVIHDKNYGFCEGYNRSISYADGEYLAFLNNDTYVDRNWLTALVSAAQEYRADICGSKMLLYDNQNVIDNLGLKIAPVGSGFNIGYYTRVDKDENSMPRVSGAVSAGAMLIGKQTFLRLGGFDPHYFAYGEDVDLCWRAWLWGHRVIHVPRSIVYHKFGGSWGSRRSSRRTFLGEKNSLANIIKNFEFINVVKGLAISLVYDVVKIIMFLVTGQFGNILALANGIVCFVKELPKTLEKRRTVQRNRQISDRELYELGLISPLRECITEFVRLERMTASQSKPKDS